jgi:hypothetical protein
MPESRHLKVNTMAKPFCFCSLDSRSSVLSIVYNFVILLIVTALGHWDVFTMAAR